MEFYRVTVLVLWAASCMFSLCSAEEKVKVTVQVVTPIATTDKNFICATVDWWPINKCDYNQCPWGMSGLLNLDLENKILANAIKAFDPLRIRLGGSLQDQVMYKVGRAARKCRSFRKTENGLFGFTRGCLPMERWDELNKLFNETGVLLTFGLNALHGRRKVTPNDTLWVGDWNAENARDFMIYTAAKGYKIDSYELGNELSAGGVAARVDAEQYGKDMVSLRNLVNGIYPDSATRPKVLGPGGFFDKDWFNTFLQTSGPQVVDAVTHHTYNLGAGVDSTLINKIQDPYFLSRVAKVYKDVSRSIRDFGPWSGPWVGEAGGAYNSGGKDVSHTFVNGFWYLDQLGMTSTFDHKVFCRQSLIGGNYGLLNTSSFVPNPDYYGALLWHRLMGKDVLRVTHDGSPFLRVYAHCSKNSTGMALLLINMSNSTSVDVLVEDDMNLYPGSVGTMGGVLERVDKKREEYHLTPEGGNIQSDVLLLNGSPLKLTPEMEIPDMKPQLVDSSKPIRVGADSFVFAVLKGFPAPACSPS